MKNTSFITDKEKMRDFKILTKEKFLKSYSYLTEAEYDLTVKEVNKYEKKRKWDMNFLDDIYDTLMKNTQYKVRDFTKYKNVYVDRSKGYIQIGKRRLILEENN